MSAVSPTLEPVQGGVRRRPRAPRRATKLLVIWLVVLAAGLGVYVWSLVQAGPFEQWEVKGPVVAVLFLNWGLLYLRAKVLLRLDERVKRARGAVCLNCHTVLTREGQEGTCPACGEAFTLTHLRDVWNKHTP